MRGQRREQEDQPRGVAVLRHLLDGEGQRQHARAGTAVFGRQGQSEQTDLPERREDVVRVLARLVELCSARGDDFPRDPARGIANEPVLL